MAISERTKLLQDEMAGWIASQFQDRMARYARDGRRHGGLDGVALEIAWVRATRAMAVDVGNSAARERQHELEAEYRLRRMEPPYHLVTAEIAAYAKGAEQMLVEMVRDDPERVAALSASIEEELAAGPTRMVRRS